MYSFYPFSVESNFPLGGQLFLNLHMRLLGGKFGEIPKPLSDDIFAQAGYCIDAPEMLPAGSCYRDEFGPDADDWTVSQRAVERQ